jgi:hypothetical protein
VKRNVDPALLNFCNSLNSYLLPLHQKNSDEQQTNQRFVLGRNLQNNGVPVSGVSYAIPRIDRSSCGCDGSRRNRQTSENLWNECCPKLKTELCRVPLVRRKEFFYRN